MIDSNQYSKVLYRHRSSGDRDLRSRQRLKCNQSRSQLKLDIEQY